MKHRSPSLSLRSEPECRTQTDFGSTRPNAVDASRDVDVAGALHPGVVARDALFRSAPLRVSLSALLLITLASACSKDKGADALPGGDVVVAEVDGAKVTQYELDTYLTDTLGEFGAARVDDAGRKKALEGLVATKVIAKERAEELSDRERVELDRKVQAYREQLLVRDYLSKHAPPQPVTAAQIEAYYVSHKAEFAAQTERTYELLFSDRKLDDKEQAGLVRALASKDALAKKDDAWPKRAAQLRAEGFPIKHRTGVVGKAPLHPKLVQAARRMKVRQPSQVMFLQGRAFLLRVTGEKQLPARTLQQASGEIRQRLAPLQVKKSVAKVREEAMKTAKVVYRPQR